GGGEQPRARFGAGREGAVPARERLKGVLHHYGEAVAWDFGWCMVRAEDQDLSPAMSRHIKALKSEIDQGIRRLIREGIQDGSIEPCDPKMTAFALAGALNWIAHWYREDQSLTGAQIAAAFVTVFEGGLRPRGGRAAQRAARPPPGGHRPPRAAPLPRQPLQSPAPLPKNEVLIFPPTPPQSGASLGPLPPPTPPQPAPPAARAALESAGVPPA